MTKLPAYAQKMSHGSVAHVGRTPLKARANAHPQLHVDRHTGCLPELLHVGEEMLAASRDADTS